MTDRTGAAPDRFGVVVIGRNEGERLRRCLASLAEVAAPLVYVDSGSSDSSVALAASMGAVVVELDMATAFSAARARNAGWRELLARWPHLEFVQFVDGDCEVASGWLTSACAFLGKNFRAAAVCGRRKERFPEQSVYNRACDAEWDTPIGKAEACGGDAMFRASALCRTGGFNPAILAGEEPEFCARLRGLGFVIWRLDAPMTLHDAAMTKFSQWWIRARRSGFGYAQAFVATRADAAPLYRSELKRAGVWAGMLPLVSAAGGVLLHPAFLGLLPLAMASQIVRLHKRFGWSRAGLLTIGKFAELQGILGYLCNRKIHGNSAAMTYK